MASAAALSAIDSSSPPMVDPTAPGDSRDAPPRREPELLLPGPQRGREHRAARRRGARRAAAPGRALRDHLRRRRQHGRHGRHRGPARRGASRTWCGWSITASTRAMARPSAAASAPRAIRSSASPTVTGSSGSRTWRRLLDRMRRARRRGLADAPRRRRRLSHQACRSAHPARLRAGLPGLPAGLLRPPGAGRRLRLQALPSGGAGGHPAHVRWRVPVGGAAHQAARAAPDRGRGGRAAPPADGRTRVGRRPAGRVPGGA